MGNSLFTFVDDAFATCNPNTGPLLRETRQFSKWSMERVTELQGRFRKQNTGFGLVRLQFDSLLAPDDVTYLPGLFALLDTDNNGRVDLMEFMSAVAIVCKGSFDETTRFIFELVDFNLNGSLSFYEMVLMIRGTVHGLLAMLGAQPTDYPSDEDLAEKVRVCVRVSVCLSVCATLCRVVLCG
jgi:Ca2+-binding EF-hand superfamily protein